MKMKRFMALLLCIGITGVSLASIGCSSMYEEDKAGDRLSLKVFNYNGGVGNSWLNATAERFMEVNKDRQFGNGKVGVYVDITNEKEIPLSNLSTRPESIFFLEGVEFNQYAAQGDFVNIDDVVKTENPYEQGKKIEDNLSVGTKNALTGLDGHYYVIPHYQSYDGVTYNKTVFDNYNLYFAKYEKDYRSNDPNDKGYGFIENSDCEKSVGPNGKAGDYDDGLPSSIDELIRLCEYIKENRLIPFIWYNGFNKAYQQKLTNALWASLEGYDGTMAQFVFDSNGTETSIVTGFDAAGNPITEKKVITEENAWEIYQQESRYHALRFTQYLFSDMNNYHPSSTGSLSNTDIQKEFMQDDVAMLIEGTYWRNEAADAKIFDRYSALKNVETRYMPLPVQGTGSVTEGNGKEPNVIETHMSYAFIVKNTEDKYGAEVLQMAKEFLQFCCTAESLSEFTVKSSVTKDYDYTVGADYSKLTDYAKSVWDIKGNGKVVNPISDNPVFIKNIQTFTMRDTNIWKTTIAGGTRNPCDAFAASNSKKYTARDYFEGMKKDKSWWDALKR